MVLEHKIFKVIKEEYNEWYEKLFMLWHVAHGMPFKLMTESN